MTHSNTEQNTDIENQNEELQEINNLIYFKITSILIILGISIPYIILDLYYGYNDKSCVSIYTNSFNIRIKEYLLVSGYLYLILSMFILLLIIFLNKKNGKNIGLFIEFININLKPWIFASIIVWHILGSIIFWNEIYPKKFVIQTFLLI